MGQAAILVLAGTETKADLGRVVNGLQVARELKEAGDDVTVIFDGAGAEWPPTLRSTWFVPGVTRTRIHARA